MVNEAEEVIELDYLMSFLISLVATTLGTLIAEEVRKRKPRQGSGKHFRRDWRGRGLRPPSPS